jgi:sec-independent protein translocase protein TatB
MFDIGSSEIFLILLVAIILINPKDLPSIIKKAKVFLQNFSSIKQEFTQTITKLEDTIKQADLSKSEFEEFKKEYLDPLNPKKIKETKEPLKEKKITNLKDAHSQEKFAPLKKTKAAQEPKSKTKKE